MKIAIWTTKAPKVDGIKDAVKSCPYFENIEVEYILQNVDSGISSMPLSLQETMLWAKNRAQNLKKSWTKADFYVGVEWGTLDIAWKKYIWGIIYIENELWEWHFWFSAIMEVPKLVVEKLYTEKLELWPVMSELSGITNIAAQNGSMWAWSDNMITRKDEFEAAFKAAISPFFNAYYKL